MRLFIGSLMFVLLVIGISRPVLAQETQPGASGRKALLPDISLIGSLAWGWMRDDPAGDQGENPARTGITLQGLELGLQSVVDPYVRGDVFILLHEHSLDVEEATLTTLSLPVNFQVKAGKLLAKFGRENARHLEQLGFVDSSRVNRYFLGNDGLHELGAEVSALFPIPWFSELTFEFLQGENPGNFDGTRKGDFAYLGHWTNGFDITPNLAAQTGLSGVVGFNDTAPGNMTQIYGADFYLRWKPSQSRGLKWQTEYFLRRRETVGAAPVEGGLDSQIVYQFARRWETGLRIDRVGMPSEGFKQWQLSPDLTFLATEFFRLRGQYNFIRTKGIAREQHEAFLQIQFNMGPHGAHGF